MIIGIVVGVDIMVRIQVLRDYNGRCFDDSALVLSILCSPYVSSIECLNYYDSSYFTLSLIDDTSISFNYVHN